jgi:hypothetical protein
MTTHNLPLRLGDTMFLEIISPNPAATAYGVYSDYESDATGEFTVTVGVKVGDQTNASVSIKQQFTLASRLTAKRLTRN